ncbi:MAG: MFS transporter [Parcubacteria group bacterium]
MNLKHNEKLEIGKVELLCFLSLLLGLSQGVFVYVMSTYFKQAAGTENIGVFYLVSYAVILIAILNLHKVIKIFGKAGLFHISLFLQILAIIALLLVSPGSIGIMAVVVYIIFLNLQWLFLDILLEAYSTDKMSGRIRGIHLTVMNVGFLLSPLISASILEKYGYYGIFFLMLILNTAVLFFGVINIGQVNHNAERKISVRDLIKKVWKRKDVFRIFYISFILDFFFALMIIYMPLYLIDLGFNWEEIGIIFTVMLIPFVLVQYPAGILADKKLGEKEMLIGSILIMGFSTLAVYFIASEEVFVWAVILLLTRIGAAFIQILRDSYFYKRIDANDVDLINFFRTSYSFAYIFAAILSAIVLFFFSLKTIFILIAIVVFSSLYPAFHLEDNEASAKK